MRKTYFTSWIYSCRSGGLRRRLFNCLVRGAQLTVGATILAGGMAFVGQADHAQAAELIVNGGFEDNNGFNGENSGFGWNNDSDALVFDVYSHTTQIYYAGTAPSNSGAFYFHTVGITDTTGVYQDMNLTDAATINQIDAGTVAYDFTAFLAGYTPQDDHPRIELVFFDSEGEQLGGVASVLDGGVVVADGTLVFDTPDTFVSFVDGTLDPLDVANNPIAMWKEYGNVAGVPVGARSTRVTILEDSYTGNGNDDYVDNISLDVNDTGQEQFLSIEVNKTTGAILMQNNSPSSLNINFYEILSDGGVLNASWNSFANQTLDSQGPNPEDNWQAGGGSSANLLTEAFLTASSTFELAESQTLASGYAAGNTGAEDLVFQYGLENGSLLRGIVKYTTSPGIPGDFDFDGDVDGNDYLTWQRGGSPNPLSSSDLDLWETNFGNSSTIAATSAVPEPGCLLLFGVGLASITLMRRTPRQT